MMLSLETVKPNKGIIFAGCSFTWGQGLYYYSNLDTLKEPLPDHYDPDLVRFAHEQFMKSVRYPRLVAQHFKSFEFVHPRNGGSNEGAVEYWKTCLNTKTVGKTKYQETTYPIDYSEISHVVFQLTQWQRDNFIIEADGQRHDIPYHCINQEQFRNTFFKWLDNQGLSIESFTESYIQRGLDNVKNFLQECENNGVKTILFTWPSDYLRFIERDPWLKERTINFQYNGKTYRSIEDLMWPGTMQNPGYNPELTVKWDYDNFKETPKDHHPSLKCHQVMAENVIRAISSRI